MQVTFGLRLDERQGPSDRGYFREPVVGRMGLLGLLETYLGLARPEVPQAQRVAAYLGHLRRFDNGSRFYSRSLQVDDVGTAALLLSWRDEWRLGGWDGRASPSSPQRIQELASVEEAASGHVAPGEGERLVEVASALAAGNAVPISQVMLADPSASFPAMWRAVLKHLKGVQEPQAAEPEGKGQLRELQRLAAESVANGQLKAPEGFALNDGTVQVLQAQSRETAEHWLSAWCRANPANRLVLCEQGGDSLDATLMATGAAACGFDSPSSLRPALQTLGLALEMLWAPLHVGRLVEFLVHPYGPFSRAARGQLARAIAEQPGLGGEAWNAAKTSIGEKENAQTLLAEVAFWLEGERWSRADGAPITEVAVRVEKVRTALQRRAVHQAGEAATIAPALRQCEAVLVGLAELRQQGLEHLAPRQIEQLLAQSTPAGATNPAAVSQVGCLKSATTTAACLEPAGEVVWWMPSTPALPRPLPWSQSEVDALRSLGVELRDPKGELELLAVQWLRPLFAAKERFVLVLPPPGAEEHPIWQLIRQLAPKLKVHRIDDDLYGTHLGSIAHRVTDAPLQRVGRYLELERPLASRKKHQSYTALNELFNNPALAVLKDVAQLRPGSGLDDEHENKLLGNLAHRVIERFFQQEHALHWTSAQAGAWFDAMVDELLLAEGAPLLMQGAGVSMSRFKRICRTALLSLLTQLQSAGAVRVQVEVPVQGLLGDVEVIGKIDLLVELPQERSVTLDLKWSGTKRHGEALVEGRHLQLALYASLTHQVHGQLPVALGYFVFDSATLLISTAGIFPDAQVRKPAGGITVNQMLAQARGSWTWRMSQWAEGIVELVDAQADIAEFQGPEGTLPVTTLGPFHREHLTLLGGWEQ
ncbi:MULTISPECIES: PD-(D/E)XK nuclease family protein [unclassified Variovorax]|uniref:PD-(D/E)XK nuclease family protein n=1 Tax=unclassified Variovorax TaxID=663243 RepID=UPI0008385953|nr:MULTISPECIES: PD-(D/E)XK nuclease family protein [unclassified Variovorax]PNG50302.1 hypothetical protein CHC06_05925 [Variovorax sp. B2]PNG51175.1 hypothetical protein CHC07_05831 [Variovorax sp. B4]VTV17390.1 hypothetical protein WDL1P1_00352 [Variovorax sp. WDL1]